MITTHQRYTEKNVMLMRTNHFQLRVAAVVVGSSSAESASRLDVLRHGVDVTRHARTATASNAGSSSDRPLTLPWLERRAPPVDSGRRSAEPWSLRDAVTAAAAATAARASYDIRLTNWSCFCCRSCSVSDDVGANGRCGDRDTVRLGVGSTLALVDRYMLLVEPIIDVRASVILETTSA